MDLAIGCPSKGQPISIEGGMVPFLTSGILYASGIDLLPTYSCCETAEETMDYILFIYFITQQDWRMASLFSIVIDSIEPV